MRVIKRYPNRKLYDTEAKQYISLERIGELIREGEEIHVVDHATREDLTKLTLTQVILEQEKKQEGELSSSVLTALIRASSDTLNTLRRTLTSPLDWLHQVDEEIDRRLQALVRHGEIAEEEGRRLRDQLLTRGRRAAGLAPLDQTELQRVLTERGTPTRDDVARLGAQLDALSAALEELEPDRATEPARPPDDGTDAAPEI